MRTLFVSRDYALLSDGGMIVTKRNLDLLRGIGIDVDVIIKPKASLGVLAKNIIRGEGYGVTRALNSEFHRLISNNKYDFIWCDGSCDSSFIKQAHKKNIPAICFYHNVESVFYKSKAKTTGNILDKIFVPYINRVEKTSTRLAKYRILLNHRDAQVLESIYGETADLILPTSFDPIEEQHIISLTNDSPGYLLFVGSNFWANVEGLEFFFNNIANLIDNKIKIIGSVCDSFNGKALPQNVELLGRVDNLDSYYANATAVISPILSGSGTKTKTIEALKYGKTIIGSEEALMGIPSEWYSRIGYLCKSPEDYIQAINQHEQNKYNKNSIKLFNEIFSSEVVLSSLREFINTKFSNNT
ncbi:MAG: glycosyltransferase family 4 protein [Muribaculum sp.]|nr:glycosyltransferase family 4 protein [Muribaculum sp.]